MDHYSRGRPQGYTSGNRIPDEGLDDIQPDYEDEPSPRSGPHEDPWRNVTGQRSGSPVDYIEGGQRVPSPDMDRYAHRSSGDRQQPRYRPSNITNSGRDQVNQGYRDSGDDLNQGGVRTSDRDRDVYVPDTRYGQEYVGPVRQHSRLGSGAYDNQGFPGGETDYPVDDYERQRYEEGRPRSPEVVWNEGFRMTDNNGYNESPRDFRSDSHPQQGMHGSDVESGRDHQHYIQHNGRPYHDDTDNASIFTLDFGHSQSDNVWNKLHTIRLRRKSQKSRKLARTLSRRRYGVEDSDEEEDEENEGLLPSLQNRAKPKSLHERLAAVKSTTEAAATLRDNVNQQGVASVQRNIKQTWQKNRSRIQGWLYQLELWATTFKEIEGRFGTATVSYFRFTRWLMFLNLYIFLLIFCVVVIPYWALNSPRSFHESADETVNKTNKYFMEADQCTQDYATYIHNLTALESVGDKVLDFVQGTGWMERTELFYGVYYNRTYPFPNDKHGTYNMSLAYVLTTGICFLISFILIVKNSGKSVKEAVVDQESSKTLYCNKVFCGWDYCISNKKAASTKMKSLKRELADDLEDQRRMLRQANRTTKEKCSLFFIRLFIHLFVMATLGAALYLVYFTTDKLIELETQSQAEFVRLVIQYLPSLTITVLNFLVPLMFAKVVIVENYGGAFELKITLIRTVLLRLASLGVLIISLYIQLLRPSDDVNEHSKCGNQRWIETDNNGTSSTAVRSVKCWETYVGQQFYKLALLDLVAVVLLTFLVEFPRKLVYQKFKQFKLVQLVGEQEFDLPKNVLDIVYSQTLCWLGMFFSPMIPAITLLKVFIIFYVKRLTVLNNCIPPLRPYRASRSNSFFMTVLLISFVLSVIPLGYLIGNISPSQSCGPFRWYSHEDHVIFDTVTNTVKTWPVVAKEIFFYLGTVGFFVPAIILLCLLMYYYWAASQGYKKMEQLLKDQLKMEGRDRQFLLSRVNDVIQRGELGTAVNG